MEPAETLYLNISEMIVTGDNVVISTVLGSCISVCIFSQSAKVGGMIHYALPEAPVAVDSGEALRYGNIAIPTLIQELKRFVGTTPKDLMAKVVGGASEINSMTSPYPVGSDNIKVAKKLLSQHGIPIVGESTGDLHGRKVLFHIPSGRLQVAKIKKKVSPVSPPARTKVLIVDDSKTIRDLLHRILKEDPGLEVIGAAADPVEAASMITKEKPDVITLDIHMPKMTGVEWLESLLPVNPIPVVMISSLQLKEGNDVFRALELGAIDYIQKPSLSELGVVAPLIREKVKAASRAKVLRSQHQTVRPVMSAQIDLRKVLVIGASTGGTEALRSVLCSFPRTIPPTLIVQHIPPVFSKAFADRLNELCPFEVKEAEDKDELKPSRVLIAPGGKQMKVEQTSNGLRVRITDDPPMSRHKPSVDYLFHSVASTIGNRAVGVILTGMGSDGAKGLLEMKSKGARTIGQDEASSVVYGMPRVAFEIGAVEQVASLSKIPQMILNQLERRLSA